MFCQPGALFISRQLLFLSDSSQQRVFQTYIWFSYSPSSYPSLFSSECLQSLLLFSNFQTTFLPASKDFQRVLSFFLGTFVNRNAISTPCHPLLPHFIPRVRPLPLVQLENIPSGAPRSANVGNIFAKPAPTSLSPRFQVARLTIYHIFLD